MYDAYLLDKWDHTASIAVKLHNLTAIVACLFSKQRPQLKSIFDFHPYREGRQPGFQIRDIQTLKMVGNAMVRNKK